MTAAQTVIGQRHIRRNGSTQHIGRFVQRQLVGFDLGCRFHRFRSKYRLGERNRHIRLCSGWQLIRPAIQQQLHLVEAGVAHVVGALLHLIIQSCNHRAIAHRIIGSGDTVDLQCHSCRQLIDALQQHLCIKGIISVMKLIAIALIVMLMILLANQRSSLGSGSLTVAKDLAA